MFSKVPMWENPLSFLVDPGRSLWYLFPNDRWLAVPKCIIDNFAWSAWKESYGRLNYVPFFILQTWVATTHHCTGGLGPNWPGLSGAAGPKLRRGDRYLLLTKTNCSFDLSNLLNFLQPKVSCNKMWRSQERIHLDTEPRRRGKRLRFRSLRHQEERNAIGRGGKLRDKYKNMSRRGWGCGQQLTCSDFEAVDVCQDGECDVSGIWNGWNTPHGYLRVYKGDLLYIWGHLLSFCANKTIHPPPQSPTASSQKWPPCKETKCSLFTSSQ